MTDLAIAHKDYNVRGGGEILAETMADGLDCPLIVGHDDPDCRPESVDMGVDIREVAPDSRLHTVADRGGLPRTMAQLLLWRDHAHEHLDEFDVVVTSGNEPRWWTPRDEQVVVAYTHTTPRHLYNLYNDQSSFAGRSIRQAQRVLYQTQVPFPDLWVCNSELVERRIQRYYGLDDSETTVVYPPVETADLSPKHAPTEDYYLTLGRLADVKNLDQVIRACNATGDRLIVAGTGPEREHLEELAGPTVKFAGWVEDDEKAELLSGARALIHACDVEDFGMATAEALATGTPVIGITGAYTEFQIADGVTGVTFEPGELEDVLAAFDPDELDWSSTEIAAWADQQLSRERFIREMRGAISTAVERAQVTTKLYAEETEQSRPDPVAEALEAQSEPALTDGGDESV